jgi:hypothetical protein
MSQIGFVFSAAKLYAERMIEFLSETAESVVKLNGRHLPSES